MDWLLLAAIIFIISAISVFFVAKKMKKAGVLGKDVNKLKEIFLPEATGIALLVPLWIGILYIFFFENPNQNFLILGLAATGYSIIGFMDDLKKKIHGSLSWLAKAIPVAIFSIVFSLLSVLYIFNYLPGIQILLVPLFAIYIVGIAALENTFAGLNGWEIGSGFIIACFVALLMANSQFFLLAIVACAMILGLLFWNFFPAKVFPGDSGTLLIGGTIASIMILGSNILEIAIVFLFFLPHLIDFFILKLCTNKKDVSQKKIPPYKILSSGKIAIPDYADKKERLDFAKLLIKIFGPMKEWKITLLIWIIVFLNCSFWIFVYEIIRP